jgi:DNA polymerase-3 subunit epsilon
MNSDYLNDAAHPAPLSGTVFWRDVPPHILDGHLDFAVIDVETTGLFPGRSDRIVEFAVLRLSPTGSPICEYVTLVNPRRDIGPTWIHGITASDVKSAPTFEELAGDILDQIKGAVLVAHNVRFDKRFMLAEFGRVGCLLPDIPAICTLGLSYRFLPQITDRRLIGCCAACGIPLEQAHSALVDARAVAALFRIYLNRMRAELETVGASDAQQSCATATSSDWPSLPRCGRTLRREKARARHNNQQSYISQILERLPINSESPSTAAYMDLLELVLEDRRVSPEEAFALHEVATEYGLSQASAQEAHFQYLRSLVRVAYADGYLSEAERLDLSEVAALLGCQDSLSAMLDEEMRVVQGKIQERTAASSQSYTAEPYDFIPDKSSLVGKTVCFTGESRCRKHGVPLTRSVCRELACNAGLVVAKSVTKTLDILVVADPETMSGKADKARRYGTRIMAEVVFWRLLGISVD